jgi:hypothetical protein
LKFNRRVLGSKKIRWGFLFFPKDIPIYENEILVGYESAWLRPIKYTYEYMQYMKKETRQYRSFYSQMVSEWVLINREIL